MSQLLNIARQYLNTLKSTLIPFRGVKTRMEEMEAVEKYIAELEKTEEVKTIANELMILECDRINK